MLLTLGTVLVLATHLVAGLDAQPMDEYRVKAAFLYNFARFVDWPPDTFHQPEEQFAICVLGRDPFGQALDDVIAGKAIAGHSISVRRLADAHKVAGCRVLFVSPSEPKQVMAILAAARQPNVLTVGEAGSIADKEVIITFVVLEGKVRFGINQGEAEGENLRLSSKLLSLAVAVKK